MVPQKGLMASNNKKKSYSISDGTIDPINRGVEG